MFLSNAHIEALSRRYHDVTSLRGRGESAAGQLLTAVETVGAGVGMAYCNARYAEPGKTHLEVMGVPLDLALGMGLGAAALFGVAGRFDEHVNNVASGLLTTYGVRQGAIWGTNARVAKVAEEAGEPAVRGMMGVGAPRLYPTVDAPAVAGAVATPQTQVAGAYGWE